MKSKKIKILISVIIVAALIVTCVLCFKSCGSSDPSKLIFSNSPYVEYDDSWTSSDWESFNFEIKKSGTYSFEYTQHKYSIENREYTTVNFDKIDGDWEFIGTFKQDYVVYQTSARLTSVPKSQSFAIYKLNGLFGGFMSNFEEDGTITKDVKSYQGYCVYRYGDTTSWSVGKTEGICIFFTDEIIDETLLNKSVDNDSLSTGWRYGSIGLYNYSHTVKV